MSSLLTDTMSTPAYFDSIIILVYYVVLGETCLEIK